MADRALLLISSDANAVSVLQAGMNADGKSPFKIETTDKISQALTHFEKGFVTVAILDLSLANGHGFEVCRQMVEKAGSVPLFLLLSQKEDRQALELMRLGLRRFLIKESLPHLELARIFETALSSELAVTGRCGSEPHLSAEGLMLLDWRGQVLAANASAAVFLNSTVERLRGCSAELLMKATPPTAYPIRRGNGESGFASLCFIVIEWNGEPLTLVALHELESNTSQVSGPVGSEQRYRRLVEAITDYIYTVRVENGAAVETHHGPASSLVTGYTPEELARDGYLWIEMVHPGDRDQVREAVAAVLTGKGPVALEHRLLRRDGVLRWVSSAFVPHFDAQGNLKSYDGLVRDITERKEAELALREMRDSLERTVEVRTSELQETNTRLEGEIVEHRKTETALAKTLSELKKALSSERILLEELDKKNRELTELSITDGLTGLYNHRFLQDRLDYEFSRAKRYQTTLSLGMTISKPSMTPMVISLGILSCGS